MGEEFNSIIFIILERKKIAKIYAPVCQLFLDKRNDENNKMSCGNLHNNLHALLFILRYSTVFIPRDLKNDKCLKKIHGTLNLDES